MTPSIELTGVGKRYVKYEDAPMLVTRALKFRARTRRSRLWALRDIDLRVEPGECLGVIGRNGSGKSTMLRMLAGVTGPSEGRVAVRGRVAPLISVGVGFHPELTGRENVYVNGTVLGLSRSEIDQRFDRILDFAEVEEFIDTPVKFYSSGMLVRLGFAVAVEADPEVLLVDEVLAVGDIAFQLKSFERMQAIRASGATVVVVSHNLGAIRSLCERTVVLHRGALRHDGDTDEAIGLFHDLIGEQRELDGYPTQPGEERVDIAARFTDVELIGADGRPAAHAEAGDEVLLRADVAVSRPLDGAVFGLMITSAAGVPVYSDSTPWVDRTRFEAGTTTRFEARMRLNLGTGSYQVQLWLRSTDGTTILARNSSPLLFYVSGRQRVRGIADLGAELDVTPAARPDSEAS